MKFLEKTNLPFPKKKKRIFRVISFNVTRILRRDESTSVLAREGRVGREFKQTSSSLARGCIGYTRSRVNMTDRVEPLETWNEGLVVFLSRLGSPL